MRRGFRLAALLLALALTLSACAGREGASQDGAGASLPSPPLALERQILGDGSANVEREVTLYRASDAAMELTTVTRALRPAPNGSLLESAVEELLIALPGEGSARDARAELVDVEFGGGVATVRLSLGATAGESEQDYLVLCASIANTLLGIEGVTAVNLLCGDRSNPICALPTGVFTQASDNLPAAYAQMQSERERFLQSGASPLERQVCLYFPARGDQYLLPEVRDLSFPDEDYASVLIDALLAGPERDCCMAAIPANLELLDGAPQLAVTPDGERVLELRLSPVLANYLALAGVETWQFYGSLVLTLTSFLPELDAVRASIGGTTVTECDLGFRMAQFADGRMRRADFSQLIGGSAWLYFLQNGGLTRLECAVSQASATSAQSILSAMITLGAFLPGLESAFPVGIGPEDVLGVSIENRVATVNLSGNFYCQCQSLDAAGERALIYAMVNALTELDSIGAVSFLVEGRQIDSLVGDIYLRSSLMPNPGIVREYAPPAAQTDNFTEGDNLA